MSKIQRLYDYIKSSDTLITVTVNRDYVFLDTLISEEGFEDLSLEEWKELVYKLYFDGVTSIEVEFGNSELGNVLSDIFDYDDPETFKTLITPKTPPRGKAAMVISPGQPFQGTQNSCFAHAATSMILRNVYKFVMTDLDTALFIKNNCNQYLDTTRPLKNYASIEENCGVSGAKRILLFRYIYRVITNEYGCNFGHIDLSALYYLQATFKPVFPPAISEKIRAELESRFRVPYTLSVVSMSHFNIEEYRDFLMNYFKEYYAVIKLEGVDAHTIPCIGIDDTFIYCKDSSNSQTITIPIRECHEKGEFMIGEEEYTGVSFILFLFETSKLATYPEVVKAAVLEKEFGPSKDFPEPIDFPEYRESKAAESIANRDGGKSRKKRKTRRKRSRKRKN